VVQFSSVVLWFISNKDVTSIGGVQSIPPVAGVIGLALMVFGQTLNAGIYRAIGHVGVYYGFKLGHTVPWVDGFPFSVVAHPQYVGSVLSVWGAAVMWWSQAPDGLGLLVGYWTLLYVFTGMMEH
jgi:methylene-fatty-acyl-phospholipid synthase